jgi:hypothetical protein
MGKGTIISIKLGSEGPEGPVGPPGPEGPIGPPGTDVGAHPPSLPRAGWLADLARSQLLYCSLHLLLHPSTSPSALLTFRSVVLLCLPHALI